MVPLPPLDYAGDVSAQEAWDLIQTNPKAQLIDVRTMAEWNFVGLPDLTSLGRRIHCVEWQGFPGGALNPGFVDGAVRALEGAGADKSDPILFCADPARVRVQQPSRFRAAGYSSAFNVTSGFEGDADREGHRGNISGWKACGLPWRQG